jgi:hypothetical protein
MEIMVTLSDRHSEKSPQPPFQGGEQVSTLLHFPVKTHQKSSLQLPLEKGVGGIF